MRILILIAWLMMLSLGFTAPLSARDKGGKSGKAQAKENKQSAKPKQQARGKGNQNKEMARRPDDGDRHDGDRDRHDNHDARHDANDDSRRESGNHDHDWQQGRHQGYYGDRHDNGWHKGWYKHDKHQNPDWHDGDDDWHHGERDWHRGDHDWHDGSRHDRDNDWWRDRDHNHADLHRDRDGDWNTWRGSSNRLSRDQQLLIEQRNRDRRIDEAQFLRQLAERNGNANLASTADRMEDFARDHYARRAAELTGNGVTDPLINLTPVVNSAPAPLPVAPASSFWNWWPFGR
jgi:hypothetical protein